MSEWICDDRVDMEEIIKETLSWSDEEKKKFLDEYNQKLNQEY